MARVTSRWMTQGWMTAGLASRGRRLLSAAVAIVIGVAFLTASLVVLATAKAGVEQSVAAGVQDADLVLSLDGDAVPPAAYDAVAALDGVESVRGEGYVSGERGLRDWVYGGPLPASGVTLLSGQMPAGDGEVLISTALADEGLAPGEALELAVPTGAEETRTTALTVSGVADFGGADMMLSYGPTFAASDATLREIDPNLTYQVLAVELSGADDAAVREALTAAVQEAVAEARGGAAEVSEGAPEPLVLVQTGAEAAEDRVASLTGDTAVFAAILLGFGAVALLTAAIVIANTFTITLAQRTAELALLRCVGATRGQVRRQVVLEAVVLGVVASAVGVGLGTGAGAGLLALGRRVDLGIPLEVGLQVGALSLLAPVVVGTLVTVLASLWPAVRATRVSPLAALRPAGPVAGGRRVGWVRLGVAVLLIGAGVAAMVYAASEREILAGVAGGVVSFVGVLVAAVVIVPAAVRGLGLATRVAGVPGRLAVDNAVRNPGRAAATSAALLVGVTLITMTSVGAATGQRTALGEIDRAYAVDFLLTTDGESRPGDGSGTEPGAGADGGEPADATAMARSGPLPVALEPSVPDTLAAVDGIAAVTPVDTAYVVLGEHWAGTRAVGLDPRTAGATLRSETLVASVRPDTVGLSSTGLMMLEAKPGDTLRVTGAAGARDLTVTELGLGSSVVLHEATLADLAGDDVRTGGALLRMADEADVATVMADVNDVADDQGLLAEGAAVERAVIVQVLDMLVMVTTALLGAAVVIAVVGIANTLSLSVVERHREHALLRGLGLTRGQMRGMLLTEGVLLALVSAVLGLLLGLGYAVLGIQTLLPADTAVQLAVPWARVGIIVGLALVAGVLASVLPARRATRVSPAEGLAAA